MTSDSPSDRVRIDPSPGISGFELPGARQIVGRGFDLALASSSQVRRASLYVGVLVTALVAPTLVLALAEGAAAPGGLEHLLEEASRSGTIDPVTSSSMLAAASLLALIVSVSVVVIAALVVDAQVLAVAILAGQLVGRPLSLQEALTRARQTFWRVVMAWLLISLPLLGLQSALDALLADTGLPAEGEALAAAFLAALAGSPFGYVLAGIVIGEVGPGDAIARSVRLARIRWRLALVIALFATVFSWIEILALGVGADAIERVAEAVHLGFEGPLASIATTGVILAAVAAATSLIFTAGAVTAAPQVVAFLGLTHYHAGLDQARARGAGPTSSGSAEPVQSGLLPGPGPVVGDGAPSGASHPHTAWEAGAVATPATFRWITRPMLAALGIQVGLAILGVTILVAGQA